MPDTARWPRRNAVSLAFCWSHVRRRFYELAQAGPAPIAAEALERIAELYRIEDEIRGRNPDARRAVRQQKSSPSWQSSSSGSATSSCSSVKRANSPRRSATPSHRWAGLTRFLDDGRIEIDNNVVERLHQADCPQPEDALFAGSDGGGEHWATIASLVETCKLNGVDPQAYLSDVIARIVAGHPQSQLDELLPWAYAKLPLRAVA